MIKINKRQDSELFEAINYTIKAMYGTKPSDSLKPTFCCLWVLSLAGNTAFAASDTRRAHFVYINKGLDLFEVGQAYEIVKATKSEILLVPYKSKHMADFPDILKVVPEHKEYIVAEWKEQSNGARVLFDIYNKGVCANPEYIKDAMHDKTSIYYGAEDSPLYFHSDNFNAVIMPVVK
jgi:hypothetical protein